MRVGTQPGSTALLHVVGHAAATAAERVVTRSLLSLYAWMPSQRRVVQSRSSSDGSGLPEQRTAPRRPPWTADAEGEMKAIRVPDRHPLEERACG